MHIVGGGFLARHLGRVEDKHDHAVAFAAGVSSTRDFSADNFERETQLLDDTLRTAIASGRTIVFFSTASAALYDATKPGREADPPVPRSPYGAHKLALERRVIDSGADHLILRLSHLVGPHQRPHQLLPTLVRAVTAGRVEVQQRATRDLLAVEDAVTVVDRLLLGNHRGLTVNVACGHAVAVDRIVDHLAELLRCTPERSYRDVGTSHAVSIERLRRLVDVTDLHFGPSYYRRALDSAILGTSV